MTLMGAMMRMCVSDIRGRLCCHGVAVALDQYPRHVRIELLYRLSVLNIDDLITFTFVDLDLALSIDVAGLPSPTMDEDFNQLFNPSAFKDYRVDEEADGAYRSPAFAPTGLPRNPSGAPLLRPEPRHPCKSFVHSVG